MPTTTSSDGVEIHYDTIGAGADAVLVHGITDSSAAWGPIPELLAEREYRVTTLDLRGMGRSGDADDYGTTAMVGDLAAVVAAADIVRPLVVGHSLGGVVVTGYAATSDVRAVVNVDQSLQLSGFKDALAAVEPMLRDPNSFDGVMGALFGALDGAQLPSAIGAQLSAQRRVRQEVVLGVWNTVLTSSVAELDEAMAAVGHGVSAPYLALLYADAGELYADWLHGIIPHAVVEHPVLTVEHDELEYGHYGHRIDPVRFLDRVVAFDPESRPR